MSLQQYGSQASITAMGSANKINGPSKLGIANQNMDVESDREKENKFTFNPRVSKYGQGSMFPPQDRKTRDRNNLSTNIQAVGPPLIRKQAGATLKEEPLYRVRGDDGSKDVPTLSRRQGNSGSG